MSVKLLAMFHFYFQCDIDPKTAKYLVNFRDLLDGIYQPSLLSVRTTAGRPDGSDAVS